MYLNYNHTGKEKTMMVLIIVMLLIIAIFIGIDARRKK